MIAVLGYDGTPFSDEARRLLDAADLVIGGARHLAAAAVSAQTVQLGALEPAVDAVRSAAADGRSVVVIASGDPGFFGILRALRLAGLEIDEVRPAVSSVARAFALAGLPWTEADVVSAHGRDAGPALNVVRRSELTAVLTSPDVGPREVAQAVADHENWALFVAERLGEADERTGWYRPTEVLERHDWRDPNVVISADECAGYDDPSSVPWRAGPVRRGDGWALPDEAFEHRDGMITKPEVRAVVLARLGPRPGVLVWDVGAGSGAVGVECARLGAAVVLVERDAEQVDRADTNASLHGRCRIVHGEAPAALEGLPHPDAVFVGGGGPDVVAAVAAVRPQRVVVALATLERVAPTVAALEGYETDTVLVQVSRLQPLGEGSRLAPANPVFLVSGALP